MIKAVFFDLYGTLAGFSPSRYEIQSQALTDFGITVTEDGILRGYALADAHMSLQNTHRPMRSLSAQERSDFFAEYERLVLEGAGVQVSLDTSWQVWQRIREIPYGLTRFGDVLPAFEILKERGLVIGLISNMNQSSSELTRELGLSEYLDFAVTSIEVGSEKPHPPIFLKALEKAGVEAADAVHVGDQISSDIEGARNVGINPVLLDRDGNHPNINGTPRIVGLDELPPLLESFR
jgi:putative hydrolase of the HAD superfamily